MMCNILPLEYYMRRENTCTECRMNVNSLETLEENREFFVMFAAYNNSKECKRIYFVSTTYGKSLVYFILYLFFFLSFFNKNLEKNLLYKT